MPNSESPGSDRSRTPRARDDTIKIYMKGISFGGTFSDQRFLTMNQTVVYHVDSAFESVMRDFQNHFWSYEASDFMPLIREYYQDPEALGKDLSYRWNDLDVDASTTPRGMGMRRRAAITVFVERGLREPAPLEIICQPNASKKSLAKLHLTIKLLRAVKSCNLTQVKDLLQQGAGLSFEGVHCETPLRNPICEALRKRRPALVEAMFEANEDVARKQCRRCFHDAIRRGDIAHMESNIRFAGVNCSLGDWIVSSPCGRQSWFMHEVMPLHLAIAWEQIDAAIWLLQHGANPYLTVQIRLQVLGLDFAPDALSLLVFGAMFIAEQRFYNELYWQLRKAAFLLRFGTLGKHGAGSARSSGRFTISRSESSLSSSSSRRSSRSSGVEKMSRRKSGLFAERFRDLPPELFQAIVHFLA